MDRLLEATALAERSHFWFRGLRRFVRPLLLEAAGGRRNNRVLDCGCGTGASIEFLSEFGRIWAFDLTWAGLQRARARDFAGIVRATVEAVPFASGTFDIVTSFDVLVCVDEEVERAAVSEMWRVLRPGGCLIVNVAAMPVLRGNHSILSGEIRRYDRQRLESILQPAGFQIKRLTHTNAVLWPLMFVVRLLQRTTGHGSSRGLTTEISLPPAPINSALSGLLAIEAAVQQVTTLPFGSSLLCLARKA